MTPLCCADAAPQSIAVTLFDLELRFEVLEEWAEWVKSESSSAFTPSPALQYVLEDSVWKMSRDKIQRLRDDITREQEAVNARFREAVQSRDALEQQTLYNTAKVWGGEDTS